jgi:hypothetical protein
MARQNGVQHLDPGGNMQKTLYVGLDVHKATLSVTARKDAMELCA